MIDLGIDNEINQNNETKDEIGEFVKELQNSLTKEEFTTTLNMEILNEITLATKYKEQLDDIVNKYMEENYKNKVSELVEKGAKNIKEKSIPLNNGKPIFEKSDFN